MMDSLNGNGLQRHQLVMDNATVYKTFSISNTIESGCYKASIKRYPLRSGDLLTQATSP